MYNKPNSVLIDSEQASHLSNNSDSSHGTIEIVRAPKHYLEQLDDIFISNLETIPVTQEQPWDKAGEILLRRWLDEAEKSASMHSKTAYRLKHLYRALGMAIILSTSLVALMNSLFPCASGSYKYVSVFISFISLIFANLSSLYNYGPKYQQHFTYEGLYYRYAIDIQEILVTEVSFRPPKDKTIVEFRERKGNLITSAPEF